MAILTTGRERSRPQRHLLAILMLAPCLILALLAAAPIVPPVALGSSGYEFFADCCYLHAPGDFIPMIASEGVSFGEDLLNDWHPVTLKVRLGRWVYKIGYYPPQYPLR